MNGIVLGLSWYCLIASAAVLFYLARHRRELTGPIRVSPNKRRVHELVEEADANLLLAIALLCILHQNKQITIEGLNAVQIMNALDGAFGKKEDKAEAD